MIQALRRIWSLSVKEFLHLRNDWWLPAFMLFGGAMELVRWSAGQPIEDLSIGQPDLSGLFQRYYADSEAPS